MSGNQIRVGVIGANPDQGWASRAHIPALRALPEFRLTAVGTSKPDSAERAARIFGAAHAFTDARRLAAHPEVDVVAITVRVPFHDELIRAALDAGKHVYCEWPLVATTDQAAALTALARDSGVHHAVGLQARYAPAVRHARALIADGYVGQVLSATVYAARGKGAGARLPSWAAYTLDSRTGAGMLEVGGGHTLDTVEFLLGDIAELSADLALRQGHYVVEETGDEVRADTPDHLLLHATVQSGAVVSVHIHDAKLTDARTRIDIAGTEGDLAIVSGAHGPGGVQMSELRLLGSRGVGGAWQELSESAPIRSVPDLEAANVAAMYAALASDIRTGARTVPDFRAGLHLHRLLDVVRRSADTGARSKVGARERLSSDTAARVRDGDRGDAP